MSGAISAEERETRWSYSVWYVENQSDASTLRHTLKYRLRPGLQIGIEVNAITGDVEPLISWLAVEETEDRPALVLGSGTNGISSPGSADDDSERIFHATAAKNLGQVAGIGVAPYVSLVYLGETDEFAGIYGVTLDTPLPNGDSTSLLYFFDGDDDHSVVVNYHRRRHTVGLILKGLEDVGVTYSYAF